MKQLIIVLIAFAICSCGSDKEYKYTLLLNPQQSIIEDSKLIDDSIVINIFSDSIFITKYYQENDYLISRYYKLGNSYFEKRYVTNVPENIFNIDTILTFSKRDTVFIYNSLRDKFVVSLVDLALIDGKYTINYNGDNYKTIRQSLIDTTYSEIYFYDRNYNIYKYINTWKNNKCVYVRKE